ncbi:hypothetical protein FVR03_23365 [Pontibacter qinzhouensis]|uniref:Uncharacterized protein n=1 Tax=Pontibacter qinzhouensis TaxID=2603253 RepID=A0A5C8IJW4_9BACT|nr:hypothetical protein [Pontibacter qinzhouensis]TXK21379.1 hypothetical protein FVR03_23365 [Pontibacter qinzhouensis]
MKSVKLSSYYRLYAFSDYQSMKTATRYMRSVELARGLAEVQEQEVRRFVGRISGQGYINYLEPNSHLNTLRSYRKSFITALQLLYKSNGYAARYIVIERI